MSHELARGIAKRFELAVMKKGAAKESAMKDSVAAARDRVSAEFDFIGYIERIYLATQGGGHAE